MNESLQKFIQQCVDIQDNDLEQILSKFTFRKVKRNESILNINQISTDFFFIVKGCIRVYFITSKGKEKTNHIGLPNSISLALSSFISQTPSIECIDAIEESELLCLSHSDFYNFVSKYKAWEQFYIAILEQAYITKIKRIEMLTAMSAKERYTKICNDIPNITQLVSNKVLSSYLNMSEETLSRLKSL